MRDRATIVLAVDIGGTGVKVALVDRAGGTLALARRPAEDLSPHPGWVEQDAGRWWTDLVELVAGLASEQRAAIGAIAVTGAGRSQVLVDERVHPVCPAIMFRDSRAVAEGQELAAALTLAPGTAPLDAYHPLARLAWLERHRPDTLARARHVVQPKDLVTYRLGGRAATDPVSDWQIDRPASTPGSTLAGLVERCCPKALPIGQVVAPLGASAARQLGLVPDLPIVTTGPDTWCATLAAGVVRAGGAYISSGSSEVLGVIVAEHRVAPGLLSPAWGDGLWHLGGPSQTGGATLEWLSGILGQPVPALLAELESAAPPAEPLFCLPYLAGERVPLWRAELRGRMVGLGAAHRRVDLTRAVVEGIAYGNRSVLERAEAAIGRRAPELRITGGLARSRVWCRLKADILDRPIVTMQAEEGALLGAAMVAWWHLGAFASLEEAQARWSRPTERHDPDPRATRRHDLAYRRWCRELRALLDEGPWTGETVDE